jgi:hypothetical protein
VQIRFWLRRLLKWAVQMTGLWLAFSGMGPKMWWLFVVGVWQVAGEIVRHSIRRKLPVSAWPKQLYL